MSVAVDVEPFPSPALDRHCTSQLDSEAMMPSPVAGRNLKSPRATPTQPWSASSSVRRAFALLGCVWRACLEDHLARPARPPGDPSTCIGRGSGRPGGTGAVCRARPRVPAQSQSSRGAEAEALLLPLVDSRSSEARRPGGEVNRGCDTMLD